jgi:hypothetical protein
MILIDWIWRSCSAPAQIAWGSQYANTHTRISPAPAWRDDETAVVDQIEADEPVDAVWLMMTSFTRLI